MSTLLATCLGVYLFMAITVFKSDKTQLVFDLNRSQVSNLTSELETQFGGVSEKLKIFALLPPAMQAKMAADLLSENSDIVAVSIFKSAESQPERSYYQDKFLETYGLDKAFFGKVASENPIPFAQILQRGEDIWNASAVGGPPLIGYGRLVVMQDERGMPLEQWAVVGFVKLDRFLKSVSIVRLSEVVVANRDGEVLVHPDAASLIKRPQVRDDVLFSEALNMKAKVTVVNREIGHDRVLGALAKGFNDQIFVVAKASENQVFQVVRDLSVRTALFGSIVLTLVILAAFLLSRSLTENIAILVDGMESVAKGDLTSSIHLRGRDETVLLANSFNQMIHDLKESRDALETMNRELDQKVKERTLQLEEQNKKVKEVQEALIHTTRLASVGEIAGRTAHEVLNPLTILLTRAGLVQKKVAEESPLPLLEEIRQAWSKEFSEGGFAKLMQSWQTASSVMPGKSLLQEDLENIERLTADLKKQQKSLSGDIEFIRMEGERIGKIINGMRRMGHLKSDVQPHSVHAILSDCCHIMNDLFEQRGFRIEQAFLANPDVCPVDRDEMIQSVTNLMRNSLQALEDAHPSNPTMTVRTESHGEQLWIDVEDNGVGVRPEHQSKLFESSFTTKSADQGTGLGLGIARRFVREFGGDIEFVTSVPLNKTVFRIRLPLKKAKNTGAAA
ncbi:MAG: HAMP domain-containing protein [Bdellovibrionales bacterium]|nr:HAMP domain-containing protein [Bdellovibrionales bacterium]